MSKIKNVFVLMLENRSFDHMLGFSGIEGKDAVNGQHVSVNGLKGRENQFSNTYDGTTYHPSAGAKFSMPYDPNHEFIDVVEQLTGHTSFSKGQNYPPVNNSGFVSNYNKISTGYDLQDIMRGYTPEQLPIMNTLAKEFAVCDQWYASMPGPTWPNRFFVMAATALGWDDSPGNTQMAEWETGTGLKFPYGNIFSVADNQTPIGSRIYMDRSMGDIVGTIPICTALYRVSKVTDVWDFENFHDDLQKPVYPYSLTFIEPSYGEVLNDYIKGSSQHPKSDVRFGEALIKKVYEGIRNSSHWNDSLLIITYDEHGGFYDHVAPPDAIRPDNVAGNEYGFKFDKYGVRVPALIISPYIEKNIIDKRLYDHSSVSKTLSEIFNTMHLTDRDKNANSLTSLLTLSNPRTDAPTVLPDPASDNLDFFEGTSIAQAKGIEPPSRNAPLPKSGNFVGFLYLTLKEELEMSSKEDYDEIKARFQSLKTRQDGLDYVKYVTKMKEKYEKENAK
jgi:phospholipase C